MQGYLITQYVVVYYSVVYYKPPKTLPMFETLTNFPISCFLTKSPEIVTKLV